MRAPHIPSISMSCQKCPQIALGDSYGAPKPMRHKITGPDPPPDRAGRDGETLRNLGDGEEFDRCALMATSQRVSHIPAHRATPYSEVEQTGLPSLASA
jgi:hypothetical protein